MVDYHNVISEKPYNGEYDNLLFFFKFMYEKIHQLYSSWYLDFPSNFFETKDSLARSFLVATEIPHKVSWKGKG